ncbi:FAR1-related sequence 5-like protein [Tanacetum coccineum]
MIYEEVARKDATQIVANLQRQQVHSCLIACDYLEANIDLMDILASGYENPDMALHYGAMLRECIHENNDEFEHTLIDDIDNNGYLMEEEVIDATHIYNGSLRYTILGRTFSTSDDAYDFYNEYGLSKGFGFMDMNDKSQLRGDVKRRCITRTGCKALMQVTLSSEGEWVVDQFSDEHNHPFDSPSKVIKQRSHSIFHRSNECKDVVTLLSKAGMKPSEITKIINAFRGGEEEQLTRVQCCAIAELDKDFYFAMDINEDGVLQNVFWADGRSRTSYCQFGDVVVFDVTYRTNKFSFPFAPFVGVNHHDQSILLGAALLENETEKTFKWLFEQFLKCMHECPRVALITDQDLAMGKAISKVFPNTKHRYCSWHIQRHVLKHLQPFRSQYDDFEDTYKQWVKSQYVEEFELGWEKLKKKYHIE